MVPYQMILCYFSQEQKERSCALSSAGETPEHWPQASPVLSREGLKCSYLLDLHRQLPSWCQDQGLGLANLVKTWDHMEVNHRPETQACKRWWISQNWSCEMSQLKDLSQNFVLKKKKCVHFLQNRNKFQALQFCVFDSDKHCIAQGFQGNALKCHLWKTLRALYRNEAKAVLSTCNLCFYVPIHWQMSNNPSPWKTILIFNCTYTSKLYPKTTGWTRCPWAEQKQTVISQKSRFDSVQRVATVQRVWGCC